MVRRPLLKTLAIATATAVVLAASLMTVPAARAFLGGVPPLKQARTWLRDVLHPPIGPGDVGSGEAATAVLLHDPMGIAAGRDGSVYVSDRGRWQINQGGFIWKIGPDRKAEVIAGTGRRGSAPAGVNALEADLGSPEGLCVDPAGRVTLADSINHVVLRIEPDGRLARVAGTGEAGDRGDGGPATEALLNRPFDVRCGPDGSVYLADYGNHRVRVVGPDGVIRPVAGTGEPGYAGDGGPATAARLNGPYGVVLDPSGRLLIADSGNHVIRAVDKEGTITTLAGTGVPGYAGDGGPARAARFDTPQALAVGGDGRVYVDDEHNHAVRVIGPDGGISTLVGGGEAGFAGDGGPATRARLNDPENLLPRDDGSLLITDGDNWRVRIVGADGKVRTYAGRGPTPTWEEYARQ